MGLLDFLKQVVPAGHLIVATKVEMKDENGKPFSTFSHTVCQTHEDMAAVIQTKAATREVYFALASYKQGFHENEKGKKVVRVRENVLHLQALWFDIDFKSGYADAKEVIVALRKFCQAIKLPAPSILIGSGNGIHVYWLLTAPVDRPTWQRLADALKEAAKVHGLHADLVCTADACRILRPPETQNRKDPQNPKPVEVLYTSGKQYDYAVYENALLEHLPTAQIPAAKIPANADLTGGLTSGLGLPMARFDEIVKHCAVAKLHVETHGKTAPEPEWVAVLQLLKHCEDGSEWIHPVSDGHPSYTAEATERKWQQRLANTAGPTLCKTFEAFRSAACSRCPHYGFIKTPVALGHGDTQDMGTLPSGWRVAADGSGVEKLQLMDATVGSREWVKVMRYIPSNFRVSKSVVSGEYAFSFDIALKNSERWTIHMPTSNLGNMRRFIEELAGFGVVLKDKEVKPFGELMATWLSKLQEGRRISDTTGQLGWLVAENKAEMTSTVIGFSCGTMTYYTDGRSRDDVRPAREFEPIARLYEPKGALDTWKKVAGFIAEQNNPSLTAVLAASFGAPLLKFTGLHGGILSIVSTVSGVGKSSALKTAQAVWGNPTHGINSVDDTHKSVAKKLGYLNNLPAFWDELRGRETVDGFAQLAFQVTQGKEKTRLTSQAELRDFQTWETMLIVASNESIFEAMGRATRGTNAGLLRTFEMHMDTFPDSSKRAETTILFESLTNNYGHAGRVYAQYLAQHLDDVRKLVQDAYVSLDTMAQDPSERYWFGMVAALMSGARIAAQLDLVKIDEQTLYDYLIATVDRLRDRAQSVVQFSATEEILNQFFQHCGGSILLVDQFPARRQNSLTYQPTIKLEPRTGKCIIHMAEEDKLMRFSIASFENFLQHNRIPMMQTMRRLRDDLHAITCRPSLGIGTKFIQPRTQCLEVPLPDHLIQTVKTGCSSNPDDSLD